jgi:ribosome production factor 1
MRQHRYIFEEDPAALEKNGIAARVRLQELGPRMTLKLMSIQEGTFDTLHGEYEFIRKKKDEKDSRRKFAL